MSRSGKDISQSWNDISQSGNDISVAGNNISPRNKTIALTIWRKCSQEMSQVLWKWFATDFFVSNQTFRLTNELHFHITDEGLSISRNVWLETKSQWQTISIEPILLPNFFTEFTVCQVSRISLRVFKLDLQISTRDYCEQTVFRLLQ